MEKKELQEFYNILNKLIKESKIRFNLYNSDKEIDLIQCTMNNVDNTIDLSFRDIMTERIDELRQVTEEYLKAKEK